MRPLSFIANANRTREILSTLVRWGFEEVVSQIGALGYLSRKLLKVDTSKLTTAERVRLAFEELGPTFIKLGQFASTRPDILPAPYVEELKKLRSHVDAVPFEEIYPVLLEELGTDPKEIFAPFSPEPFAAGSIGQVYRTRQLSTSMEVAVKIQRPGIQKTILADLDILGWLVKQVHERIETLRHFNLPSLVEEGRRDLLAELDFRREARNATLFNSLNSFHKDVFAPRVFIELSSRRILVTEWVDGVSPEQAVLDPEAGKRLAHSGGSSIFEQVVVSGFFHSDPHGGNILITPDHRLCLLDWGQAGQLTREMRYLLADFFAAIGSRDAEKVVLVAVKMGRSRHKRLDLSRIEKDIALILRKHSVVGDTRSVGFVGLELLYCFSTHGISISSDYALLAKSVMSVERTGLLLDPDFDIWEVAKPFANKLRLERWNPFTLARDNFRETLVALETLREIPGDAQRILRRIEDEDIALNLSLKDTHHLERTISVSFSRLTVGIVLGSLIIGSSTVINMELQPLVYGYSAIGVAGFLLSAILGFSLVFGMIRNRELK
ncbi:MAG: ABC1 kinase family protein [Puniceicoccaceae bacterium]